MVGVDCFAGKVCVPIPMDQVDTFDPMNVPTLPSLINELNAFDKAHPYQLDEKGKPLSGKVARVFVTHIGRLEENIFEGVHQGAGRVPRRS